jgi:hypothetical protein
MTIAATTTFTMSVTQMITRAFNILGKGDEGEDISTRMYNDGLECMNLLVKTWQAQNHLWTRTEGSLALVAGQAAYALSSPQPIRVLAVRRRTSSIDTPLGQLSREEYFDQPNKTLNPSTPVSFYFDPQVSSGTLYLWPAPSTDFVSASTVTMTYLRRLADFVTSSDNLDAPQEWLQTIIWNLANDLETQYPVNDPRLAVKIERKAATLYQALTGWDQEPASLYMQPDFQSQPAYP